MQQALAPVTDTTPPEHECRALVNRILASQEFRRTVRLREFLLYIVNRRFSGGPRDLTEVVIGRHVFGRPAGYNPGEDSIVRTEARNLRQRLASYFEAEGRDEPIILQVPKGGYVPVFTMRTPAPAPAQLPPAPGIARRVLLGAGGFAALVGAAVWKFEARPVGSTSIGSSRQAVPAGAIELKSSNWQLDQAFRGAKERALGYTYTGDPVGNWYDSTAGERYAFCMRDLAHQSIGAAALGLTDHTLNMLRRFALSIAETRDWCGFWEINKDGFPAPVDYRNDADFWYCLPANFDLMRACYRQMLWTNDPTYADRAFSNFYDRTVTSYVEAWDRDRDGVMEGRLHPRRRGIPSYYQEDGQLLTGGDLLAAQYMGYLTYASIQERKGERGSLSRKLAEQYRAKAEALRRRFNDEWWDATRNRYYSAILSDRRYTSRYIADANVFALLFGITEAGLKTEASLDWLEKTRPEFDQTLSYFPEILFQYGRNQAAYRYLLELSDPAFKSRSMPEISFAVVGAIVTGLMGVEPEARESTLTTIPRLPPEVAWCKLTRLTVLQNEIVVEHRGLIETTITNHSGPVFYWKPAFASADARGLLWLDGEPVATDVADANRSREVVFPTAVTVRPGQTRTARYVARSDLQQKEC